jgi:hypothetical protein
LFSKFLVALLIAASPIAAAPFGTVNEPVLLNQHNEHEMVTRLAFQCPAGQPSSDGICFESLSLDQLAGTHGLLVGQGENGGVGSPDSLLPEGPEAHCDDADFLDVPDYPRDRWEATAQLQTCVNHLRLRFEQGWRSASRLLNDQGQISTEMVSLEEDCPFDFEDTDVNTIPTGRAKCNVLEGLGRALHGVQDFYSHSNWADQAKPGEAPGVDNPPGLNRDYVAPFLDLSLSGNISSMVPRDLSTGCFSLVPFACSDRITHGVLNKDHGIIYLNGTFGEVGQATDRGQIPGNFQKAVFAAVLDSQRQWALLRERIRGQYGVQTGNRMICALVRDDPVANC